MIDDELEDLIDEKTTDEEDTEAMLDLLEELEEATLDLLEDEPAIKELELLDATELFELLAELLVTTPELSPQITPRPLVPT